MSVVVPGGYWSSYLGDFWDLLDARLGSLMGLLRGGGCLVKILNNFRVQKPLKNFLVQSFDENLKKQT